MRQVPKYYVLADRLHFRTSVKEKAQRSLLFGFTVNSEIFARILFLRIAFKTHIFDIKIREKGVIYLYQ